MGGPAGCVDGLEELGVGYNVEVGQRLRRATETEAGTQRNVSRRQGALLHHSLPAVLSGLVLVRTVTRC